MNPYQYINTSSLNNNKKFYILIYNYYDRKQIYLKRPMSYSNIKLNKINVLPQLSENNKKYYYQIELPEPQEDYNYLLIQTKNYGYPLQFSLSKNYIFYHFINDYNFYDHHFNIPYDKRKKKRINAFKLL